MDFIQSLAPHDIGRQIAHTHTIFATLAVLIELPMSNMIVKISRKIIPVLPEEQEKFFRGNAITLRTQFMQKQGNKV